MAENSGSDTGIEKPQQIAAELRGLIVSGELADGEGLGRESDLVERFGVARPTLREALRILETEALISVVRGSNGGVFVRSPDRRMTARSAAMVLRSRKVSLADVFEARSMLEPMAARTIATRRRGRRVAVVTLRALIDEQRVSLDDLEAFGGANVAFHEALVTLAGSTTLTMFAETLNEIVDQALIHAAKGDVAVRRPAMRARDLRSQERLLELIDAGDPDGAETHWRTHMVNLSRAILGDNASTVVDLPRF